MPTAEQTEYRPPTQSQKAKALLGSMPNSFTSFRLVDTATMCFATAFGPSSVVSHVLRNKMFLSAHAAALPDRVSLHAFR